MLVKNKNFFKVSVLSLVLMLKSTHLFAAPFQEKLPVYGVIKPGTITTLLGINHGIVSKVTVGLGNSVERGTILIEVMEKETIRFYRSGIKGSVAKFHVTNGAAITPGMPLVTVLDPAHKVVEVSLSAQDAETLKVGSKVKLRGLDQEFGVIERMSPLVDPDTGAVTAFVRPSQILKKLVGDVVALDVVTREIADCQVVMLRDVDQFLGQSRIEAVSGTEACLLKK